MIGKCRVVGTFLLWQGHCEEAEMECPVHHVGSGVLWDEDAQAETGSSLMLTTHFHCLKGHSVETGFVCSFVWWDSLTFSTNKTSDRLFWSNLMEDSVHPGFVLSHSSFPCNQFYCLMITF